LNWIPILTGVPYDFFEGLLILASVLSILVLVIILMVIKKLDITKELVFSIAKGSVQLFIIAGLLVLLFDMELWYLGIWGFLGMMVVISGHISAKRATKMPDAYKVTTPSILTGAGTVLAVLAVTGAMPITRPEFIIPLSGMAFGNSMRICSLCMERLISEVRQNRVEIETALSLGADSKEALRKHSDTSIKASLIPTLDNLKTLGIIFIPGAMSGLLMGGTAPEMAAIYQIIVYLMIVGGGAISTIMAMYLAERKVFNEMEQLREWVYS